MDKTHPKDSESRLRRGIRTPEFGVLLLAVLSLIVLLNPFSQGVLAIVPALPFLAAFALFMAPGFVLALALLPGPEFSGPARISVAFALSAGIFGLAALPELALNRSVTFYPVICSVVLVLSLGLAVVRILRRSTPAEGEGRSNVDLSTWLLWAPFSLVTGVLAWIAASNVPRPAEDTWIYLSHVRDLLESGRLSGGGFSRLTLSGWLPEQVVLSSVSGLDPVTLVLRYLAPTLVVVALLALYTLARTLLQNEKAALVICTLSALFFLVGFGSSSFESVLAPGGEFINRITEDKFVARYIFLPVALSLAILFMRDRSWRNLGLFFFICLSAAIVHPLGLVFIGIAVIGFGLVHLAISWRDRGAWPGIGGLCLTLLVIAGPPALYLLATGSPLLYRTDSLDPGNAATLIETAQYEQRLLEVGEETYIVHPSILLDPAMLAAYLLGVPFLIWKIRSSLAARLLLGVLAFVPILAFIPYTAPPIANVIGPWLLHGLTWPLLPSFVPILNFIPHTSTPIANAIGPWLLHRLTWPLLLAALLTLAWICWEAIRFLASSLGEFTLTRRVAPFLPLIMVGFFLVDATPLALTGLRSADDPGKAAQGESSCLDPTFRWMQDAIPASGKVMAPRAENACTTAYAGSINVLGIRGEIPPQAEQDLGDFYTGPTLGPDALQILERREIGYVMLPLDSPLNTQLQHLPGFTLMDNPGERYRMYEVTDEAALEPSPTVTANGYLNDEDPEAAIEGYTEALEDSSGDPFLAYLGLGIAYVGQEQYTQAAQSYEAAVELDPESPKAHELLANAYNATGETDRARTEFERAVELDPGNADLRLRYGQFLVPLDQREAVQQHLAAVDMFPKVPGYRVKLGTALMLAGATEAADQEFERAIRLAPVSASLRADIGGANLLAGRLERALSHYENALDLDPNSQLYALNLGRIHAQLSTQNGRDEEHLEEAEALLSRVEDLGYQPWESDQSETAWIALGDLYLEWDRPEDAATAYERALELNPDSQEAQEKLDELG